MFEMKYKQANEIQVAKQLAPEVIRAGHFVALLHLIGEYPSGLWCGDVSLLPPDVSSHPLAGPGLAWWSMDRAREGISREPLRRSRR